MVANASPAIQKATARVLKLSKDERARLIHEYEVKARDYKQGQLDYAIEQGISKGRAEGRAEERIAFARKMIRRNRPITEIAEDTGLSLDEIEKLAH